MVYSLTISLPQDLIHAWRARRHIRWRSNEATFSSVHDSDPCDDVLLARSDKDTGAEIGAAVRLRLREFKYPGHFAVPTEARGNRYKLHVGSMLPHYAPEGNVDVGCGRCSRQRLQTG